MISLVALSESLVSHSIIWHPFLKRCFFVFQVLKLLCKSFLKYSAGGVHTHVWVPPGQSCDSQKD